MNSKPKNENYLLALKSFQTHMLLFFLWKEESLWIMDTNDC